MSVNIAMTGLRAAQTDLSVTSNNIANVGTVGFHASRAHFGDIYGSSPFTVARMQIGQGVQTVSIVKDFGQGSVNQTSSALDLAIEGPGFFIKKTDHVNGEYIYTRSGAFGLNKDGYVIDTQGNFLMAEAVSIDGDMLSSTKDQLSRIQIPSQHGVATKSTELEVAVRFSSDTDGVGEQDAVPPTNDFDMQDPTTYAKKTPIEVLDDNGEPLEAYMYFVKIKDPDVTDSTTEYAVHVSVEDEELELPLTQTNVVGFDEYGVPTAPIEILNFSTVDYSLDIDLTGSTVSNEEFAILNYTHDGVTRAGLSNLQIDTNGLIWATYMGHEAIALGQVSMVNFNNTQGLKRIGNATYLETAESGTPIYGEAGQNGFGSIRSSALEGSNVELTNELVNLITAQRNYQASAKALETSSSLSQTILNMRS